MFFTRRRSFPTISVVDGPHPVPMYDLITMGDDLISGFHALLDRIQRRRENHRNPFETSAMMVTVQNIVELALNNYGGWAFLQLGQSHQSFLQQMQQKHLLTIPKHQQVIEYSQKAAKPIMGQARSQDIIERQQGAKSANQQQAGSNLGKHEKFLERLDAENEHNEKMKNRYADELAVKARAELAVEKEKAIEMEKKNARKLEEARQRLEKTKIENERKEDTMMRTDEAVGRAEELQRQVQEMTEKAEQEKRDSERRIEERRREAAAKRVQGRQSSFNDSKKWTGEGETERFSYENSQMHHGFTRRTSERGYGERRLLKEKDTKEDNRCFDEDNSRDEIYGQQRLLEDTRAMGSVATLPKRNAPDSDDEDSDSDEEKRQDPYKLIGLPDRERTPLKDIETTQRVLNRIHQAAIGDVTDEATRKHSEKRLIEIK